MVHLLARPTKRGRLRYLEVLLTIALFTALAIPAGAQVREGATMTVLRGQVAIIHPDGSAIQPAPSGTVVIAGDEIRTLTATGALITFFAGTEIEMGAETILVVDRVSQEGARVDISLKQVLGATISRVQTLSDPASAYRLEIGGAVAVVRGSTLAARGPETTPSGTFASVGCIGCSAISYVEDLRTAERAPLGPQTFGYTWPVRSGGPTGVKEGAFEAFRVVLTGGLENAVAEAVTTAEQREQGDMRGVPAGQVAAGRQQERRAELERAARDDQDEDEQVSTLISPLAPLSLQELAPPPERVPLPVSPPAPVPSPSPAPVVPGSQLQCVTVSTGSSCTFTLTDANASTVQQAQLIIETTTSTETRTCTTFPCSFGLTGGIFQGGQITRIFTLMTGQTVTTTNLANCNRPPGSAC